MCNRGEAEIRQDARLWSLVAELEALKTERSALEAHNSAHEDCRYTEEAFFDISRRMVEVARRLHTEV